MSDAVATWPAVRLAEAIRNKQLSSRELDVLRYLQTMMSNADIAAELFVSVNTVKTHVHAVYRKLDASCRSQAVTNATRAGLLGC